MDTIVVGNSAKRTSAKYIQVIIDHHSRYVWALPTKRNTTEAAIKTLKHAIAQTGCPKRLMTDNGSNFRSRRFHQFLQEHNIELSLVSAYHPQANGLCERVNGTIAQKIRALKIDSPNQRWSTLVQLAVSSYNKSPQSRTTYSPEALQFGRNIPENQTLSAIRQDAKSRTIKTQTVRKQEYDAKHPTVQFEIGSLVLIRIPDTHPAKEKFTPRFDGPFKIETRIGPETYSVSRSEEHEPQARILPDSSVVHSSRLRAYFDRANHDFVSTLRTVSTGYRKY